MVATALFVIGAVCVALGLYVLAAKPGRPVNRWFAAQTLSLAGWVFGIAGLNSNMPPEPWSRLAFVAASFIPWSSLGFSRTYPSEGRWPARRLVRAALFAGLVFAVLAASSSFLVYDITLTTAGPTRKAGVLYTPFAVFLLFGCSMTLANFAAKWRVARGQERAQLQYLAAGLFILGAGALTANLLVPLFTGQSRYSWFGPFFVLPLVALVGHATIRHRLMDLRPMIHQGLARSVITVAAALFAVLTVRFAVSLTTREASGSVEADVVVAVIVVLVSISAPAQVLFAKFVDPYLFRSATDYGRALRLATGRLTRLMDPLSVSAELRAIFQSQVAPEDFALLVHRPDRDTFEACDDTGRRFLPLLAPSQPLWELAFSSAAPHQAITEPEYRDGRSSRLRLRDTGVAVAVLLGRRDRRLGLLVLGPRRSGDAYYRDDLTFIESVAELASVALENATLHRERVAILQYSERLLESLDAAVIAADAEGKITRYNRAATELLELAPGGAQASIGNLPSEIAWALVLALRDSWVPHDIEVSIEHSIRGIVPAVVSTTILYEQRVAGGALLVITDLSTVRALEANERRLERLAGMARFYAGIAHEIRSPLTAISNFISLLSDKFDDPEYRETASRLLPIEVDRIVQLAERLRLMAPSEGGQLAPVDLASLLRDLVRLQAPGAPSATTVTLVCPDSLPHIFGDRRQLTQLFLNLLNNAREAMPCGGEITIVGAPDGADKPRTVIVNVIDEGTGIDASLGQRVFEPFFTTKASGSGLGLSICREIAEFHRATLTLRRAPQCGTIAEVRFPALAVNTANLGDASQRAYPTSGAKAANLRAAG